MKQRPYLIQFLLQSEKEFQFFAVNAYNFDYAKQIAEQKIYLLYPEDSITYMIVIDLLSEGYSPNL